MIRTMMRRRKRMMLSRKTDPTTGKHTWLEPAPSNGTWTCHKSHVEITPPGTSFCEPARSKCTWTFHKSNFVLKFERKRPHTSCASLRSRHVHGHFSRAILCGNLPGKCPTHRLSPRLHNGPHCCGKNPPIWPHCFGN